MDLVEVRRRAKKKLSGMCGVYKVCDGDPSRLCQGQKYGLGPGFGGAGTGASFTANFQALARHRLKTRLIGEHYDPDITTEVFGRKISFPAMGASMSGTSSSLGGAITEKELAFSLVGGCKKAGTIGLTGDGADTFKVHPGLEAIEANKGWGIPIFKPREQKVLIERIKKAEEAKAIAVGVDIDGAGSINMALKGQKVYRKTLEELEELVDSTELPFILKGIMSKEDAERALEAGAQGIGISNHGGRVLDYTPGVAEVLPQLSRIVRKKAVVIADGGVRTGFDILKMLALGADVVLIGRDLLRGAVGAGGEGVRLHMEYLKTDLIRGMIMTGCPNVEEIDEKILC